MPPDKPESPKPSAALLDVSEHGFATTDLQRARAASFTPEELLEQQLRSYRLHRFMVFSWLLTNGVTIPAHLISDELHGMKPTV